MNSAIKLVSAWSTILRVAMCPEMGYRLTIIRLNWCKMKNMNKCRRSNVQIAFHSQQSDECRSECIRYRTISIRFCGENSISHRYRSQTIDGRQKCKCILLKSSYFVIKLKLNSPLSMASISILVPNLVFISITRLIGYLRCRLQFEPLSSAWHN